MNINEVATLANRLDRVSNKEVVRRILVDIIEHLDDESPTKGHLVELYSFFLSPVPTTKTDSFDWVKQCVLKQNPREFLTVVTVRDGKLIASDGHMLMMADNDTGLPDGHYNINHKKVTLKNSKLVTPDVSSVIPSHSVGDFESITLDDVTVKVHRSIHLVEVSGVTIHRDFLFRVIGRDKSFQVYTRGPNHSILIKPLTGGGDRMAVIMPSRL